MLKGQHYLKREESLLICKAVTEVYSHSQGRLLTPVTYLLLICNPRINLHGQHLAARDLRSPRHVTGMSMLRKYGFSIGKGHYHSNVSLEDLLDELVFGRVHQLDDVTVEAVPVFFQET